MGNRVFAIIAATVVQILYGLNFTFAKDVIGGGFIKPYGFILLRIIGATLLFWGLNVIFPRQKIERKDFITLILASVFGVALNMLTFFKGLEYTTPIHASVIMISVPIMVSILSLFFLKESLTKFKVIGILLGCSGAIILTLYGKTSGKGENILLGNSLVLINAISYSIYIIIIKKLTDKYHPLAFVKWLFLFGMIMVLPFGINELSEVVWESFSVYIILSVSFVIIGATFGTYLLNPISLQYLKASTVSSFIYVQPVVAGTFAIFMGSDSLNPVKVVAACLIFLGVYIVSKKPKKTTF